MLLTTGWVWGIHVLPASSVQGLGPGELSHLEEEGPPGNGWLIKTITTPTLMTWEAPGSAVCTARVTSLSETTAKHLFAPRGPGASGVNWVKSLQGLTLSGPPHPRAGPVDTV